MSPLYPMKFLDFLHRKNRQIDRMDERLRRLEQSVDLMRQALGRIESHQSRAGASMDPREHELQVYSQWGEDGIIDHLTRHVRVPRRFFVEFGVETYQEANTRFLLTNAAWEGLILDGSEQDVARIRRDPIVWRHHLTVAHAFITRENINRILREYGAVGPIGLLSIDVDGNDYWIWEAIDVAQPAIVVIEYNAIFGPDRAVTVPYEPEFHREKTHYSHLYFGASLSALVRLGQRKGYAFVGTNRAGNNAFFVQRDLLPPGMRELTLAEGFTAAQFREARKPDGSLALLSAAEGAALIAGLPLVEIPA